VEVTTKYQIITKQVLNENTGELESKVFREEKETKRLRGGFTMIYHKSYEEITEQAIKSNKDIKLFNWITGRFTYQRIEVPLQHSTCELDISQPQFSRMIKKLIELNYIKRVSRGIYRLNPFIYLPFKSDGQLLQQEWNQLQQNQPE
jgi:predicted transcriptional regulator